MVLPHISSPPQGGAFSGDLLDQKSKSSLFPGVAGCVCVGGGGGALLQMTSA